MLDDIIQSVNTILGGVENVGKVYSYRRWAADEASFKALFVADGKILAWTITRESTASRKEDDHREETHTLVMRGWMGVKDANDTERVFQNLVESICDTFAPLDQLSQLDTTWFADAVQVRKVDYVRYGEYLCHYAELEMKATEVVSP